MARISCWELDMVPQSLRVLLWVAYSSIPNHVIEFLEDPRGHLHDFPDRSCGTTSRDSGMSLFPMYSTDLV